MASPHKRERGKDPIRGVAGTALILRVVHDVGVLDRKANAVQYPLAHAHENIVFWNKPNPRWLAEDRPRYPRQIARSPSSRRRDSFLESQSPRPTDSNRTDSPVRPATRWVLMLTDGAGSSTNVALFDGPIPLTNERYRTERRFDTRSHAGHETDLTQKILYSICQESTVEDRGVEIDIDINRPRTSDCPASAADLSAMRC